MFAGRISAKNYSTGNGKATGGSKTCFVETDVQETCTAVWVYNEEWPQGYISYECSYDLIYHYICIGGGGEPDVPDLPSEPDPEQGGGGSSTGPSDDDAAECDEGYVKNDGGQCILREELNSTIDLEKDTITFCKYSINPVANSINTLYISQFKFTSTKGLILPTTCFHNVSVEIPVSTHKAKDIYGENEIQIYPDFHDIPDLVISPLNITLSNIRNELKGKDCLKRSEIINNTLKDEIRNQYYSRYGISSYFYPTLFKGIRPVTKNGSQWLYPEMPYNWSTIDFSGKGICNN